VDKILRDEDDFLTGRANFETTPDPENQTAFFYLIRKLQPLRAQADLDSLVLRANKGLAQRSGWAMKRISEAESEED
jgi:hypothetical protein